jgi:hypothetical protein
MSTRPYMKMLVLILAFLFPLLADADVPPQINYQGYLTDAEGDPVDGDYQITFKIYTPDDALQWSEIQTVPVVNGIYNVQLGSVAPLPPVIFGGPLFLGVTVGTDAEMVPRQPLTSAPYALKARDADTLQSFVPGDFADSGHGHDFSDLSGAAADAQIPDDITIGHAAHAGVADNAITAENADTVDGEHASAFADAVHAHSFPQLVGSASDAQIPDDITVNYAAGAGNADTVDGLHAGAFMSAGTDNWVNTTGDNMNGRLEVETISIGGWAESIKGVLNTPDYGAGVYGLSAGSDAHGVHGGATGAFGRGVYGEVTQDWGVGVYGINHFRDNYGYVGYRDAGLYGKNNTNGNDGRIGSFWEGVRGYSPGSSRGVIGISVNGEGVRGTNEAGGHTGVLGYTVYGVYGESPIAAVYGENTNGNVGYLGGLGAGVYGKGVVQYAGFFDGDVLVDGKHTVDVLEITGGSDLSEQFDIQSPENMIKPGMLVSIDAEHPGRLQVSRKAYDNKIAGIISGANGIQTGMTMGQQGSPVDGAYPVALTGRVFCWADASYGSIQPGDMLTASDTEGHAMKAINRERSFGAVIGKAMTPLKQGRGLVLVLVSLQ